MGRKMKAPEDRARRNKPPVSEIAVNDDALKDVVIPSLPYWQPFRGKDTDKRKKFPKRTQEWYEKWAKNPLTEYWLDTDWEYLLTTAVIHAQVWGEGKVGYAQELRMRENDLGALLRNRNELKVTHFQAANLEVDAAKKAKSVDIAQMYELGG